MTAEEDTALSLTGRRGSRRAASSPRVDDLGAVNDAKPNPGTWHGPELGATGYSEFGRWILDNLDRGLIALAADGRIVDTNLHAHRLLDARELFRVIGGCFEFLDPAVETRLRTLLAEMRSPTPATRGFATRVEHASTHRRYRVLATPVRPGLCTLPIAVLVYIFDTHPERAISRDILRDLYGLSRAEADVAARLYEGLSIDRTANALGISANTVRTHVKSVFVKCEVHSQGELLYLLSLGPLSI